MAEQQFRVDAATQSYSCFRKARVTGSAYKTLTGSLDHHANRRPDAIALDGPGGPVTWSALAERVRRIAFGLAGLGIARGDVVGVQLPNSADFVTAFLAVTARGGVFQTLHMPYRQNELGGLLGDARAKAV